MNNNTLTEKNEKNEMEISCHLNLLGLGDDDGKVPSSKVYVFIYLFKFQQMFIQKSKTETASKYSYRLMNTSEVIFFNETVSGILCPICCKELKNILKHLNNSKSCAANIDMEHFIYTYEIVKKNRQTNTKQAAQTEKSGS